MSDLIEALEERARAGDPQAMTAFGKRLLAGDGVEPSVPLGAEYLAQAAAVGSGEAYAQLAVLAALGIPEPADWSRAIGHLKRASELGWEPASRQMRFLQAGAPGPDRPGQPIDLGAWLQPRALVQTHGSPRIWICRSLLTPAECRWLIEIGRPHLTRARIYPRGAMSEAVGDERTNSAAEMSVTKADLVLVLIHARICATLNVPLHALTPPTLLQYRPGEQFKPHYDFFEPAAGGREQEQRAATILLYLNEDYDGGETEFPVISYRFKGGTGDAMVFANLDPAGRPDRKTLHAGLPPTRGEKWLQSQWLRAAP